MSSSNRGFAGMVDRDKQRAIASEGGKAAHAAGTAHEWTSEEASAAGRKGGGAERERGVIDPFFFAIGFVIGIISFFVVPIIRKWLQ